MEIPPEIRVASGFIEDCKTLIGKFEECDSIRFQEFCQVWQSMKFSAIFTGRQSYSEMLEFCEDALHNAKSFLMPPSRFKTQIGSLYLLYGLYYKLPCEKVKIRVTLAEWKELMELHSTIKADNHTDANYILSKLIYDQAFLHVAFGNEFGFEKYLRTKGIQFANPYSLIPAINDVVEQGQLISKIEKISDMYSQAKCIMSKNKNSKRSLNLFDATFCKDFIKEVKTIRDRRIPVNIPSSHHYQYAASKYQSEERTRGSHMNCLTDKDRGKLGRGYDSDSSEEDVIEIQPLENYNPDLPDRLDESSDFSTE